MNVLEHTLIDQLVLSYPVDMCVACLGCYCASLPLQNSHDEGQPHGGAEQLPMAAPESKTLCQALIGLSCFYALEGRMRAVFAVHWVEQFAQTQTRPNSAYKTRAHEQAMWLLQPSSIFHSSAVSALEHAQHLAHFTSSPKTECALLFTCLLNSIETHLT